MASLVTAGALNGLNQLTSYAGKSLTHDAKGNVTGFGTDTFAYSSENLMTSATVGATGTTLSYDPLMRLYQTVSGASTSRLLYDGLDGIAEYNSANALQRRWVFDPTTGQPVVQYEGTGTAATNRRYLSADERGSVTSVSDSAGASLGVNAYDEYGIPKAPLAGRYGYTGQAWIPSAQLWHYKARVYHPQLGRFMQPDPIGYAGSPNLYAYVLNDPVNYVDPFGLQVGLPGKNPPKCIGADVCVTGERPNDFGLGGALGGTAGAGGGAAEPGSRNDIVVTGRRLRGRTAITHEYTVSQFTQCPAGQAFEHLLAPGMSAPGAPRAKTGVTSGIVLRNPITGAPTGDTITQVVSPGALTILNITEPGHRYHPGTVALRVSPLNTSASQVTITGVGSGPNPIENEIAGRLFFGTVATLVGILCAGS